MNVTGNLYFRNDNMNDFNGATIASTVNLTGQLIGDNLGPNGGRNDMGPYGSILSSPLKFTGNGNTIGGGINADFEAFQFSGNSNTFNGGMTLSGFTAYGWRDAMFFSAGCVSIGGTGNTFGTGAINLDRYGSLDLTTAQKPFQYHRH